MFKGFEHTAIASRDARRLAEWYVATFGFRINFEYAGNFFIRTPDGGLLEIIPSEGDSPGNNAKPVIKAPGIRHIAITVDHFDQAHETLKRKGVTFVNEPYTTQGNRLVFFEDLDGNYLHLIERGQPLPQ